MTCHNTLFCKCGEPLTYREAVAYDGRCEDCFATVWLYLSRSERREVVKLRANETAHYRMVRKPKPSQRKARY